MGLCSELNLSEEIADWENAELGEGKEVKGRNWFYFEAERRLVKGNFGKIK